MSASDKKQLKKAAMAEGLTQKQRKAQSEAQAAKRKKVTYTVTGVICLVLAIGLLVWNSWDDLTGRFHYSSVAATVDGTDYTVGDLNYYYAVARQETYSNWYYWYMYGYNTGFNPNIEDGAQWYNEDENKTYADYFRETALNYLKEDAALCAAAKAEGYTLSEEGQKTLDDSFKEIDTICAQNHLSRKEFFARQYGNGVTEKVYRQNLTNVLLADEYAKHHEDGIEVSEAEIENYYKNHTDDLDSYDFRYFFIDGTASNPVDENGDPLKDENGATVTATQEEKDAALAAAKEKADDALAEIQAAEGDKSEAFAKIAPKYVSESVRGAYESDPDYSLKSGIMGSTLSSSSSPYSAWLKDSKRQSGDMTVVDTTSGYFVVMFLNRGRDDTPTVNVRHILVKTDTTDSKEKDANGYPIPTQAARDAAKEKAQKLWDDWEAGEATEDSFAALAEEHSDDGRNSETKELNNPGGLYEAVAKNQMVPSFNDWIFESGRKAGEVGLVEYVGHYSGWHLIYFSGVAKDPQWHISAENSTKSSMQSEWRDGLIDACEAVSVDGMKYVGSANTATPTPSSTPEESAPAESSPAESEPAESQSAE